MAELVLSSVAYCKLVLHAVKYPHSCVLGVLIAEKRKGSNRHIIVDAVPLLHQSCTLISTLEAALCQVEFECSSRTTPTQIVGVYSASEALWETGVDLFASKVADKVQSHFADSVLLKIDNKSLGSCTDSVCFQALSFNSESKAWRRTEKLEMENEEQTFTCLSTAICENWQRDLVDFDNHLDRPALDYWNDAITDRIHEHA